MGMVKAVMAAYLAGILTAIGGALYAGPEALILTGLRLEAARSDYVFTARPVDPLDESGVAEVLAVAPVKKAAKR